MTNVVPLRQPTPSAAPYLLLTTLIDPNTDLRKGDLVAVTWMKNGAPGDVLFWRWWGPTGRDGKGRFVEKGSPDEHYETDGMKYCVKDLRPHGPGDIVFKILGKIVTARDDGARLTPPPKAS